MTKSDNPSQGLLVLLNDSVAGGAMLTAAIESQEDPSTTDNVSERAARRHSYRVDLESLLYTLFWMTSLDKSKAKEQLGDISSKLRLSSLAGAQPSSTSSPLSVLVKTWVYELACMFEDGRKSLGKGKGRADRMIGASETLDDRVTYERFLEILYR